MLARRTAGDRRHRRTLASFPILAQAFAEKLKQGPVILGHQFGPNARVPLRKIDAPEKHPHHKVHDLIVDITTTEPVKRLLVILWAVGSHPRPIEFYLGLWNRHLKRRVRHLVMNKVHPMFGPRQPSLSPKLFVGRRSW